MNPCENETDKNELIAEIQKQYPEYSLELIQKAVETYCGVKNSGGKITDMVSFIKEMYRMHELINKTSK